MEREIKFRGKRIDTNEWIVGNLIGKDVIVGSITDWDEDFFATEFWHKVNPKTVGQFIVLEDKNGIEIYEGDILKTITNISEDIAVVEDDTCNPCFVMSYKFKGNGHICHEYDFVCCGIRKNEVIGNIHENPELL